MRTLVLNAGYEPLAVVSFKRALVLVMNEKAVVVEHVDGEPVWGARGVVRPPRRHPADALRARSGGPAHPGDQTRGAAPRRAPVRLLRQGGVDDRPRPAALARRGGLVGEPRRLLPALQQRQGRPHAAGDVVGAAADAAAAARACSGRCGAPTAPTRAGSRTWPSPRRLASSPSTSARCQMRRISTHAARPCYCHTYLCGHRQVSVAHTPNTRA